MELIKSERNSPPARSRMSAYKPLLGLLAVPVFNCFYLMQNHPGGNVLSLVTEVDRSMPFISEFAAPYMLWYPFLFLVFSWSCAKTGSSIIVYCSLFASVFYCLTSSICFFKRRFPAPKWNLPDF